VILRKQEHVCVELTDHEIRLLWYIPRQDRSGVIMTPVTFHVIPLPPGIVEQGVVCQPVKLAGLLENSLKDRGTKGKVKARIGIPLSNGFIREYVLPWVSKRERSKLFTYLADEEIPIAVDERFSDSYVLVEDSLTKVLRVVLSGIRKSVLTGISTSFEAAGFSIEIIGFSAIAWAKGLDFGTNEHNLLIKEQAGSIQLILYKGQIPEFTRTIPSVARNFSTGEWNLEIQRILAYFSTVQGQMEIKKVVVSQGTETENLGQRLCVYLDLEKGIQPSFQVIAGNLPSTPLFERCTTPEKILAVMGMAVEGPLSYPNNFWRSIKQRETRKIVKEIVVGVCLVLALVGLGIRQVKIKELSVLEQEVFQLRTEVENLEQIRKYQQERSRAWNDLVQSPTTVGKDLVQLRRLTGNGLQFERIEYTGDALVVVGNSTEPALVQQVLHQLHALGWEKAQIKSYHQNDNDKASRIGFTLTAERVRKTSSIK
jgi:hypothetical protein